MRSIQAMNFSVLGAAALVTLVGVPAVAQDAGVYLGVNAGQSIAAIDKERIVDNLAGAGFATASFTEDERHFGFKAFVGYRFNRYLAFEGGYFDLGNFNFWAVTAPAGTLSGEISIRGTNLDLVGFIPFTSKLAAFGRVGATRTAVRDTFVGTGAVAVGDPNPHKGGGNYKFGLGLQLELSEAFAMRAEAERYRVDDAVGSDADIDLFSLGVLFRFGRAAPQVAAVVPPPPPVAVPAPAPAPPPPPPPPRDTDNDGVIDDIDKCPGTPSGVAVDAAGCPLKESITLEGVTFEYNSAQLNAGSRSVLTEIGDNLKKYPRLRIELQGHTDSVGSDSYNRELSQRRAESVRGYLIERGVAADRLTARGYGEAQPIESNTTDAGRARNRRVVMAVIANPGDIKVEGEGSAQ